MATEYPVYAVAWVPQAGTALAEFCAQWTGWCRDLGAIPEPSGPVADLSTTLNTAEEHLRRRGLNGEFKGPFEPLPETSDFAIDHLLRSAVESTSEIRIDQFSLAYCGGRLALIPGNNNTAIEQLAARICRALASVDATRGGRNGIARGLPAEDEPAATFTDKLGSLAIWESRRFHIPLSGRMSAVEAGRLAERLAPHLSDICRDGALIDEVTLLGQPGEDRPIRIAKSFQLRRKASGFEIDSMTCLGHDMMEPLTLDCAIPVLPGLRHATP